MDEFYNILANKGIEKYGSAVKVRDGLFTENDLISLGGTDLFFQIDKAGLYDLMNEIMKKQGNIPSDNSFNYMIDLFNLVQNEINNYFGNRNEMSRDSFYVINGKETSDEEKVCSLSQIKGKGIAECAEKASVANNILLMLNQMGLFDYEIHYLTGLLSINSSFLGGHAFLEFSRVNGKGEKTHIIYDVANAEKIICNGEVRDYLALYQLSENEFENFINGQSFDNSHFILSQYYDVQGKRVYSGFTLDKKKDDGVKDLTTLTDEMEELKKIREEYIEMSQTPADYNFESSRDGTMSEHITPLENRSNGIKR